MRREQSHEVTIAADLLNNWQIGEVQKALLEADAGDFATEYQVKRDWHIGVTRVEKMPINHRDENSQCIDPSTAKITPASRDDLLRSG
jgi:hypothetical protein